MKFAKEWTVCVNSLTEVYTPMAEVPPEKGKWIFTSKRYLYKSVAPISSVDALNTWVESSWQPIIAGSAFIRENLESGSGTFEVIPMSMLKAPILVKRYIVKTFYTLGGDIDMCNDPGKEYAYHVKYAECEPEIDEDFNWLPKEV